MVEAAEFRVSYRTEAVVWPPYVRGERVVSADFRRVF